MSARLAVLLVLAIHLAGASVPCATPPSSDPGADRGALAESPVHPCPMHPDANDPPPVWLDTLCPCGCESGAPPSSASSSTGPALLVAQCRAAVAVQRGRTIAAPLSPARTALAPPDHVPLAIA